MQNINKDSNQITRGKRKRRIKNNKENYNNHQKKVNKKTVSMYLAIITLNITGLNVPIKIHSMAV